MPNVVAQELQIYDDPMKPKTPHEHAKYWNEPKCIFRSFKKLDFVARS